MAPAPERYRGERLRLAHRVAPYARHVLVAGSGTALLCGILKRALAMEVAALEADPTQEALAGAIADVVLTPDAVRNPAPFATAYFDSAVLQDVLTWTEGPRALLEWMAPLLRKDGPGLLALLPVVHAQAFCTMANEVGLRLYQQWHEGDECLLRCVFDAFNPMATAEQLAGSGHPDWAYNELMEIPEPYLARPENSAAVHARALRLLTVIDGGAGPDAVNDFLLRAQQHLHHVVAADPSCAVAYGAYAQVLERAGAVDLAGQVRASFAHAYPQLAVEMGPVTVREAQPATVQTFAITSPQVRPVRKVLFLIHPAPHYGLDVLYDGLCEVLGDDQVVEWPWKPTLHGTAMATLANYPCAFERGGAPRDFHDLLAGLEKREFDCLLLGDCECELPTAEVRALVQSAREHGVPVVLVDQMDECIDMRPKVLAHLGIGQFDLYVKREMAEFLHYEGAVLPLPFGYAESKVRPHAGQRSEELFWAGHRQFGLRRLHLEHLERRFGWDLSPTFSPEEYALRISSSRMGLCLHGKGYDTVRYWELPAHGTMLLAERPPLHIPHNFVDGESAVLFDSLPELEDKMTYYLSQPQEVARIASNGEALYRQHHTSSARARQLLAALAALNVEETT